MQKALKFDVPLIYLQPHSINCNALPMFAFLHKKRAVTMPADDEDERERKKHPVLNPNCKFSI